MTKPPCSETDLNLEVVKAHIDTMRAVIREKIEGDGGELGQQLFKALKLATAKFSTQRRCEVGLEQPRCVRKTRNGAVKTRQLGA